MELEKAAQEEVVRRARDGSRVATVAMNETRRPPSGRVNGDDARVGIFYFHHHRTGMFDLAVAKDVIIS